MNRFDQIRAQILQNKKRSVFNLLPIEQSTQITIASKSDRNVTIDSEPIFSLFPLLCQDEPHHFNTLRDKNRCYDTAFPEKIQNKPFLREKRNRKGESCEKGWMSLRNRRDGGENVTSMMTRSYVPTVRINKPKHQQNEVPSQISQRTIDSHKNQIVLHLKKESKAKRNSPTRSPKRVRRFSKTRKTLSPRKQVSPIRKFSISAWEIPMDDQDF